MSDSRPEFAKGVAFVAGGSGGIGSAICVALAQAGSHVALTYRTNWNAASDVVAAVEKTGHTASMFQLDLEDVDAVKSVVKQTVQSYGNLHSVVYAGGPPLEFLYINQIKSADWARVFAADVNGCFNLIEAVLPQLRLQKAGNIVAVTTAAVERAPPRDILSAAPKAAIELLIKGVAREEGRSGIRANCVRPGMISAGLGLKTIHHHTSEYVEKMIRAIPLQRAGTAEDVADVVCFLLSDSSKYVTGAGIPVAGGLQLV